MAPSVGSCEAATKPRMEVKTGVAHGDATNADEPPSKNVRKSAPVDDDFETLLFETAPSIGIPDKDEEEDKDDDSCCITTIFPPSPNEMVLESPTGIGQSVSVQTF